MDSPKVSVIIPAYNAEKTVERTVRSVLASSIPLDVWVVDDGSTDGTGDVLDRIGEEVKVRGEGEQWNGKKLFVIHQQNCGCYQARLNALKQVKTPWFGFVDADDTIEPTMFEKMLAFAEREQLDAVRCSYDGAEDLGLADCGIGGLTDCGIVGLTDWRSQSVNQSIGQSVNQSIGQSVNDALGRWLVAGTRLAVYEVYVRPALIEGLKGGTFVWNMLYRNQYDFAAFDPTDRDTNFEDMIFNLQFFLKVNRMGFLNEPLYHYATTAGSAVHSFGENKLKDFREVCRVRRALLPQYGVAVDGVENRAWFRRNRLNCLKSTVRAANLTWTQKLSIAGRLLKMHP